jgi:hypothetical protein
VSPEFPDEDLTFDEVEALFPGAVEKSGTASSAPQFQTSRPNLKPVLVRFSINYEGWLIMVNRRNPTEDTTGIWNGTKWVYPVHPVGEAKHEDALTLNEVDALFPGATDNFYTEIWYRAMLSDKGREEFSIDQKENILTHNFEFFVGADGELKVKYGWGPYKWHWTNGAWKVTNVAESFSGPGNCKNFTESIPEVLTLEELEILFPGALEDYPWADDTEFIVDDDGNLVSAFLNWDKKSIIYTKMKWTGSEWIKT